VVARLPAGARVAPVRESTGIVRGEVGERVPVRPAAGPENRASRAARCAVRHTGCAAGGLPPAAPPAGGAVGGWSGRRVGTGCNAGRPSDTGSGLAPGHAGRPAGPREGGWRRRPHPAGGSAVL